MEQLLDAIANADELYVNVYIHILRYLAPALAALLLLRCIRPMLTFKPQPEIWAWLYLPDDRRLPLTHWESIIGCGKNSDVVMEVPGIEKNHAVLTRYDDGSWSITNTAAEADVLVNGKKVTVSAVEPEDIISIGGVEMKLLPISRRQEIKLAQLRTKAATPLNSIANVLLLTLFQILVCLAYLLNGDAEYAVNIFGGFAGITACQWALLFFYLIIRKPSFEIETVAFFLCTMGMAAIAAVEPGETGKQLLALIMGLGVYLLVGWSLRDLGRAKTVRRVAAVVGIGLLLITLVFGTEYYGAKNWLLIGGMTLQPSELTKVCFVFVGASSLERIVNKRNLILFIVYSVIVCGLLALMNDFGTALIFFFTFLVIAYMRSGSIGTIALACTSLGLAGVLAVHIAPHALRRFAAWRHIWEDPYAAGYQQTRALMCIASGGMFGLGAGNGWLRNMFAADSDIVFATLTEEWGMLLALMTVFCVMALGIFTFRSAGTQRSSFYAISGCAAASILLVQTLFNALGTVDALPLTGVTFPFVSNGGSSMLGTWGLLAFIKASDTRQNASFAVRQSREGRDDDEQGN